MDPSYVDSGTIEASTNKIMTCISQISDSIKQLRMENLALQQARSLSIVHLAQYNHDYEILQEMYNRLKDTLNVPRQNVPSSVPEESTAQVQTMDMQSQPITEHAATNEAHSYDSQPNQTNEANDVVTNKDDLGSALSFNNIQWNVTSDNPFFDKTHIRLKFSISTNSVVCSVCFSPDGSKFVFCNTKTAFIIDTNDGALISHMNICIEPNYQEFNTRCVRFSPDGSLIVMGNSSNQILVFNVETCHHIATLSKHTKEVSSLIFTSDGKRLISGGFDCQICIWDMTNFTLIKQIEHPVKDGEGEDMIVALAIDKEEQFVAVGFMSGNVGIYEIDFSPPMMKFTAHEDRLMDVAICPADSVIATGSNDQTVKVWTLRNGVKCKLTLRGHKELVLSVCFRPEGTVLLTGSRDEIIRGFDYRNDKLLFEINAHKNTLFEIAHHPTQNTFVSCSGDGLVCVWDYDLPSDL